MLQEPETYTSSLTDVEKAVIAYLELCADTRCGKAWTPRTRLIYEASISIMQITPAAALNAIFKEYAR